MKFSVLETDIGAFSLFAREDHLWRLDLAASGAADARKRVADEFPDAVEQPSFFEAVIRLLRRYLGGEHVEFDIPVDLFGLKAFTRRVLTEIRHIPYGGLASYGAVARRLGCPNGARAVGRALATNPIPVVIPCHRIIRGDGSLGGFGLGLGMKMKLLSLEGVSVREQQKPAVSPGT
jgi:methylated-DNA-[protein]-cysteine S-methyltransferase